MKEYFDLLIVAPLEEEAEAVFASFPPVEKRTKNGVLRYVVDTGVPGITAIMAQLPEWGNLEAYKQTDELLREFDAGAVICIGIAGRLSTDLKLGDVCYTGEVFDVSERSKVKNAKGKGRGIEVAFSIKAYSTDKSLTSAINHSRTDPHMKAAVYASWQYDRGSQLTKILDEGQIEEKYRSDFRATPIATNGFLVCGAVSSSSNYNDTVRGVDRKVSAIETESGGIFRAAQEHRVSALTVRGISDYADSNKNKLEASTKNVARIIAGQNAATFFKAQIHNEEFIEYLGKARRLRTGTPGTDLLTPLNPPKLVPLSMKIANAEVESKLKELCPEYPLAQRGYRLPCPRLKPLGLEDDPRQKRKNFTDIQDAVTSNPVVFADVPLNYPDLALPWVWADNLGTSIVLERQVIPIVLDANLIKPPTGELEAAASHFDLAALYDDPSAQVVFILYNVQPDSKSRGNFLATEMEKHSKARFVLMTRGEGKLLLQKELVKRTKGKTYSLCEVSFLAISEFIQASFELAATEAEVIAFS